MEDGDPMSLLNTTNIGKFFGKDFSILAKTFIYLLKNKNN